MSKAIIYLDESGDLGWNFQASYRNGGSSRHLTIAAVKTSIENRHLIGRTVKNLYIKHGWDAKKEKKWSKMTPEERSSFASEAKKLVIGNNISLLSITVYKPNVYEHIKRDGNKLYNYMIGLLLLDEMQSHEEITFIPDPRSIKVASGNSLYDYLSLELWFKRNVTTQIINQPMDSATNKGVQFSDMLSGLIQHHFEDKNSEPFEILQKNMRNKRLFFESSKKNEHEKYFV